MSKTFDCISRDFATLKSYKSTHGLEIEAVLWSSTSRGIVRTLLNIYDAGFFAKIVHAFSRRYRQGPNINMAISAAEEYLRLCQTSTEELFCETIQRLKAANYFRKKASS